MIFIDIFSFQFQCSLEFARKINSILFRFLCLPRLRKNLSTSDLRFVQSYRSRKKGIEEKFFDAEAAFLRPRPRNEQAEAEKCFRDSLFSTEVTKANRGHALLGKVKSYVSLGK